MCAGEVAEWTKAADLKSVRVKALVGSNPTLSASIESNVMAKPSVQTVGKIAKALGVPMEELIE